MTQTEKAEYCCNKGLYLEQLEQWRAACLSGFNTTPVLNAKQKALAEAAALMVLSKKYRHHFQDEED